MGRTAHKPASQVATRIEPASFISSAGLEHLSKLRALKVEEQEELQESIRAAAQDSKKDKDDSVRVELIADLHKIEASIRDLDRVIQTSLTYEKSPNYWEDVVGVGKLVTYQDGSEDVTIAILNPYEREIGHKLSLEVCNFTQSGMHNCNELEIASCTTNLAQGLIGKKVGEIVEVMLPGGRKLLKIKAVTRIFSQ